MKRAALLLFALWAASHALANAATKVAVRIIRRSTSEAPYNFVLPGIAQSNGTARTNCTSYGGQTNCTTTTTGQSEGVPPRTVTRNIQAATFLLLLPDGRQAVVECEVKTDWNHGGPRNCRMPLTDDVEAEFSGDKAKLFWPVSIDGKKSESETYRIVLIRTASEAAAHDAKGTALPTAPAAAGVPADSAPE